MSSEQQVLPGEGSALAWTAGGGHFFIQWHFCLPRPWLCGSVCTSSEHSLQSLNADEGVNLHNTFLCSFRIRIPVFFSLRLFRFNWNCNSQFKEGAACFCCIHFWSFPQYGGIKLPSSCQVLRCMCQGRGGGQALIEFTINKFLPWGLECSWSAYLLSCSFKDLTMKAASPSKPLFMPPPLPQLLSHHCEQPVRLLVAAFAYSCLWIGWGVSAD